MSTRCETSMHLEWWVEERTGDDEVTYHVHDDHADAQWHAMNCGTGRILTVVSVPPREATNRSIQCSVHIDCPAHGTDHAQYARGCLDCPGCAQRAENKDVAS